jgi:uncharacterized protein YndB with AHSA1/START domain
MSAYEFVTIWHIPAPLASVWDAIHDADTWPEWWQGVLSSVEIRAGDADDIGIVRRTV